VCPCIKRVKNHEDTKKSLAESLVDTDLLWVKNIPGEHKGTSHLNLERNKVEGKMEEVRIWVCWAVSSTMRMETRGKCPPFANSHSHCSGTLTCALGFRVQMKVEQSPGVLTLQEGRNSSLICNYSISMTSVQWFQQNPDGRLISLFYIASGMQQKGRLKSTINSKERYSQLYIRDSQPGDSATYFCAVETQCSADTWSLYTKQ